MTLVSLNSTYTTKNSEKKPPPCHKIRRNIEKRIKSINIVYSRDITLMRIFNLWIKLSFEKISQSIWWWFEHPKPPPRHAHACPNCLLTRVILNGVLHYFVIGGGIWKGWCMLVQVPLHEESPEGGWGRWKYNFASTENRQKYYNKLAEQ